MTLTTSTITGRVPLPSDSAPKYAEVVFTLTKLDTEGDQVIPGGASSRFVLDANGDMPAGATLWRNTEGLRATAYRMVFNWDEFDRTRGTVRRTHDAGLVQVGDLASYTIAQLINSTPVPVPEHVYWSTITQAEYDAAIAAVLEAQGSAASAASNADRAELAAEQAIAAGAWDYTPNDAAALAAITGMTAGETALVRDTMHVWEYSGSSWGDTGISPLDVKLDTNEVSDGELSRSGYVGLIMDNLRYAIFGIRQRDGHLIGPWARTVDAAIKDLENVVTKVAGVQIIKAPRSGVAWAVTDGNLRRALWVSTTGHVYVGKTNVTDLASGEFQGQINDLITRMDGNSKMLFIGDSVTFGSGSTNAGVYGAAGQMKAAFPVTDAVSLALGGQNAQQQSARFGARPVYVTVAGNQIPASGPVAISAPTPTFLTYASTDAASYGSLAGIKGTMNKTSSGYTFTRETAGSAVIVDMNDSIFWAEPVDAAGDLYRDRIVWIEVGINNSEAEQTDGTVVEEVARIVEHIRPYTKRFAVSSILNSQSEVSGSAGYLAVKAANDALKKRFPNNYWDRRAWLVAGYNPAIPQDVIDYNNDVMPTSLQDGSGIHPNNAGHLRLHAGRVKYAKIKGFI